MGIVAGLVAALSFGVGDFVAQRATRQLGWLPMMFWLQLMSLPLLLCAAIVGSGAPTLDGPVVTRVVLCGLANLVGAIGLYRAFEVGKLSVVSPVASAFGAVTVLCSIVAGDPLPMGVLVALGVVVFGVVLVSVVRASHETSSSAAPTGAGARWGRGRGAGWALVAAVGFGTAFYGLDAAVDSLGPAWPIVGFRVVSLPLVLVMLRARRTPFPWPSRCALRLFVVAILETIGLIVYSIGLKTEHVGIVAVIASLFAAVTVVLAQIVLRERLEWWQWAGIVALLVGVAGVTR